VNFLHFSANRCFLLPVSPLLRSTSLSCRIVSRFLLMEPRQARYLCFIFRQHFVQSSPLSSQNQSIESAPPPPATLHGQLDPTLHCYKNAISTLDTLSITQSCLHFASSLARAPHHWSSTRRCRSLLPSSHANHPSTQRHCHVGNSVFQTQEGQGARGAVVSWCNQLR
jgi:hypothetical protein